LWAAFSARSTVLLAGAAGGGAGSSAPLSHGILIRRRLDVDDYKRRVKNWMIMLSQVG
jgi:hypothetical protein